MNPLRHGNGFDRRAQGEFLLLFILEADILFLVELDHVKSGLPLPPEGGQNFIEQVILPTLARAEKLVAEKKIVAGGPVLGRIALRLIIEADSPQEVDQLVSSLPIWPLAE